ncbi:WbqC family protein [bacterium SCSIO 12741]|nr:WbqC family protein [bacterium SCSIO 12741]
MSNSPEHDSKVLAPICLFGPISWYGQLLNRENWFEVHEHFLKQTYRSRYVIYGNHGPLTLSVLLGGRSSKTKTRDIKISYQENWPQTHWRALKAAYSSSPFFEYYEEDIHTLLHGQETFLLDLNLKVHDWILDTLELEKDYQLTDEYQTEWAGIDIRGGKKNDFNAPHPFPSYHQVFMDNGAPFLPNLSVLDLIFNLGNEARPFIKKNFYSSNRI